MLPEPTEVMPTRKPATNPITAIPMKLFVVGGRLPTRSSIFFEKVRYATMDSIFSSHPWLPRIHRRRGSLAVTGRVHFRHRGRHDLPLESRGKCWRSDPHDESPEASHLQKDVLSRPIGHGPRPYVTNFQSGEIEVYNGEFHRVQQEERFHDTGLPPAPSATAFSSATSAMAQSMSSTPSALRERCSIQMSCDCD